MNQSKILHPIEQRHARRSSWRKVIKALLLKHEDMLQKLPEAIRDKIGFKAQ